MNEVFKAKFVFDNSSTDPVRPTDRGAACYFEDQGTVRASLLPDGKDFIVGRAFERDQDRAGLVVVQVEIPTNVSKIE